MYTLPKIVASDDLNKRSYVTFYFNNERIREYNGNSLRLRLNPNRTTSIAERNQLLNKLQFELHKALEAGCYPLAKVTNDPPPKELTTEQILSQALDKKMKANLSKTYKRNLKLIHKHFISFLTPQELNSPITSIRTQRIDDFLSRYNSSGTYYMDKRRDLGVLFSVASRIIDLPISIVKRTESRKIKAKLHKAYDKEQLRPIFDYLKQNHRNLYLCCLLTYGAWLRPHEEVRLLKREHFRNENSEIHLSGEENKGGKVRTVFVPDYIQVELTPLLETLKPTDNIFTARQVPFNDAYFATQWKRHWNKMYAEGLVQRNQTLYSFRHTAAVQVFKRTKDIYLLQKLLGHSSITVTLKYLRSLGEFNTDELREAAPRL